MTSSTQVKPTRAYKGTTKPDFKGTTGFGEEFVLTRVSYVSDTECYAYGKFGKAGTPIKLVVSDGHHLRIKRGKYIPYLYYCEGDRELLEQLRDYIIHLTKGHIWHSDCNSSFYSSSRESCDFNPARKESN